MRNFLKNLGEVQNITGTTATVVINTTETQKLMSIAALCTANVTEDTEGSRAAPNKATMLLQYSHVKMYINNNLQRGEQTLAELFEDHEMRGYTVEDGEIPIHFARDERALSAGQDATAFITGVGDQLRLEFTCIGGFNRLMTIENEVKAIEGVNKNPNFDPSSNDPAKGPHSLYKKGRNGQTVYTEFGMLKNRKKRQLIETIKESEILSGSSEHTINPDQHDISCIKFRSGDLNSLRVFRGNDQKYYGSPARFDVWMKRHMYVPQTDVVHFMPEAYAGGRFQDLYQFRGKQLRFELDMAVAGAIPIRIHRIGDAIR